MKTKKLHSWFSLPELGLWNWWIWWFQHFDPRTKDEENIKAMRYALANWITHLDTAELYGWGYGEELLGKAIEWYDREKLQIASKVKWSNCSYKAIKKACEKSLERMWLDYIDLYYIHWRDKQFDLKDCMKALDELVEEGKIKNIWVSNFSTESLKEAQSYTNNKIVANQVHYNFLFRECRIQQWDQALLDYCQENDVMLVAYRPLELGKLSNFWSHLTIDLGVHYDKSQAQIAINYLTSQKNVVTIFTSWDSKHIEENLGWIWWELSDDDWKRLDNDDKKVIYKSDCVALN